MAIGFNIWDDYYDDGFVPAGKIQKTNGYIDDVEATLSKELHAEIVKSIYNYIVEHLDTTEFEIEEDYDEINFKHLTHKRREKLVKELNASNLEFDGTKIDFYSES